jgi:adenylate kinase family enzyme
MRNRLLGRAKTSGRADDNPETIEKRIVIFNQ